MNYYGSNVPLSQVANISVEDGRTLSISPWESNLVPDIEKAIMKSDLGLNPSTAGAVIRVPMPALTEETRKGIFVRLVRRQRMAGYRYVVFVVTPIVMLKNCLKRKRSLKMMLVAVMIGFKN